MGFEFPWIVRCKLLLTSWDLQMIVPSYWISTSFLVFFIKEFGFSSFSFRDINCLVMKVVQREAILLNVTHCLIVKALRRPLPPRSPLALHPPLPHVEIMSEDFIGS